MKVLDKVFNFFSRKKGLDLDSFLGAFKTVLGTRNFSKREYYYGVVFSCVDAIATAVSSTNFELYRKTSKDKKPIEHDAIKLLDKPNKFQSGVDLLYLISSHIDTGGRAFIYPVKSLNGKVTELVVFDPNRVKIAKDEESNITGFVYRNYKNAEVPFEVDELIPIFRPTPFNQTEGISTIEMAKRAIESDINAQDFNSSFFINGAYPSGVLSTEQALSDQAFQRFKARWREEHEGKANAHKTAILDMGLKYQVVQPSQKDMEFIEGRKLSRDEILSIFRVHKSILGISEDVNRANAESAEYTFAKRVVLPRLELIFEKLNEFYLPLFTDSKDLTLEFSNPVPEDKEFELKRKQTGVNNWLTVNEIRAEEGYEPLDGGDILYLPSNLIPSGEDTDTTNKPSKAKLLDFYPKKQLKTSQEDRHLEERHRFIATQQRDFSRKLIKVFNGLINEIKNKDFKGKTKGVSNIVDALIPDTSEFKGLVGKLVLTFGTEAINDSIERNSNDFNLPKISPDNAIRWLGERADYTADSVTLSLYDRAREIIAANLADDVTDLDQIKADIIATFKDEKTYRVERIARTELITAYNKAAIDEYKESGLVEQVKWITAEDDRVDEECSLNENKTVKIGENFPSGHDQPPIHPNCRCDVVPYFES